MQRYLGVAVAALLVLGACTSNNPQPQAQASAAATNAQSPTAAATTAAPTTAAPATAAPAVSAAPATVALKSFAFSDGAVFGASLAGKSTTLAFGTAGGTFTLDSGGGQATGGNTFGSCILTITASTFPAATFPDLQVGKTITLSPCEVSPGGTLSIRNGTITASSTAGVALGSPSPTPTPTEPPTQTATQAPTQAPTTAPTQVATPTPTPAPTPTSTPSPTPSPSPSPSPAAGDGGWPTVVSHPIQSNEAAITGRVVHANGAPASHYCVILNAGPCAVTTDANGNFQTSFATIFLGPISLKIKGQFDGTDGPVVATVNATMTAQGIQAGTITVP